jgi:hypothetical protein
LQANMAAAVVERSNRVWLQHWVQGA